MTEDLGTGPEEDRQEAGGRQTSGYYREEFGHVARFYDFGVRMAFKWVGGELVFRCGIVEEAEVHAGHSVLDIACGTGTLLSLMAACAGPGGRAVGVDLSEHMLRVARRKATEAGPEVAPMEFIRANAEQLPFADGTFDRATASLAIHEMNRQGRFNALSEMHRVLKDGGRIVIADMRAPDTLATRLGMKIVHIVETDTLDDMWRHGLMNELRQVGFADPRHRIAGNGFFEIVVAEK